MIDEKAQREAQRLKDERDFMQLEKGAARLLGQDQFQKGRAEMTDRIDPTAEDLAIVARNLRRMLRRDAALRRDARSARDTLEAGRRFVGALRRMTLDYVELRQGEPRGD